jgi:hypothetical protein
VVRAFLRRSLSFPLYCHWQLSLQVIQDVVELLQKGKRFVLKALLAASRTLQFSEFFAHFVTLHLQDFSVWIQTASPGLLQSLASKLAEILPTITPAITGWDLALIEQTAREMEDMSEEEETSQ